MATPEVRLRVARRDDLPAILELLTDDELGRQRETGIDPATEAAFDEIAASPDNDVYVLEQDGRVCGCAQMTIIPGLSRGGLRRALVEAVRIAADRRGGGLGRRLMEELAVVARRRGCRLMQLTSDKRRPDAHRFYLGLGYAMSHEGFKLALD